MSNQRRPHPSDGSAYTGGQWPSGGQYPQYPSSSSHTPYPSSSSSSYGTAAQQGYAVDAQDYDLAYDSSYVQQDGVSAGYSDGAYFPVQQSTPYTDAQGRARPQSVSAHHTPMQYAALSQGMPSGQTIPPSHSRPSHSHSHSHSHPHSHSHSHSLSQSPPHATYNAPHLYAQAAHPQHSIPSPYAPHTPYSQSGHLGEQYPASPARPFSCDMCALSFNRHHDLKRHRDTHTGEKPFLCNGGCGKTFTRKDALKRHQLVKNCGTQEDGY